MSELAPGTAWIGGYQNKGDEWQWTDKTSWNFESWANGQPDNGWPWTPGGEHLVGTNFFGRGKWNDWDKNGHKNWFAPVRGFICQYKASGPGTTITAPLSISRQEIVSIECAK